MDFEEETGPSKRRLTTFCEKWKEFPSYAKWIKKKIITPLNVNCVIQIL